MNFDVRNNVPVVSVNLITYNHAPYIRECIDSLLMQQTGFPYEICIGEDESTDGTREICGEYADKHPDRIRLALRSQSESGREAYLSQGVYNYIETARMCRGKYMALCDGDDAWIDPLKLQKQFDIMEADPGIALVHSDFDRIDEFTGRTTKSAYRSKSFQHPANLDKSTFMYDVVQRNYPIIASTAFVRTKDVLEIIEKEGKLFRSCPMGDIITWCELVNYGSFHYQDEALGIYRILPHSDSNSLSAEKKYRFVNGASNYGLMVGDKYKMPMEMLRAAKVKSCNRYALLSGDRSEIDRLYADALFKFSFSEFLIYQAGRFGLMRDLARSIFEWRYTAYHRGACGS